MNSFLVDKDGEWGHWIVTQAGNIVTRPEVVICIAAALVQERK